MLGLTGAFSSLGINELNTASPSPKKQNLGSFKNFSSVSLPNLVSSEKKLVSSKFSSVQNNTYGSCDDEIEQSDQPIDFSKKYAETKKEPISNNGSSYNKVVKSYNAFTMYAETDLDQPTDYSLRYAEDDSESEECNKIVKTEYVQDTIKTYCTEDTPYETPFNFSTSTSMSDLRIDDQKISNEPKHPNADPKPSSVTKPKSAFSSGIMSPEKPVNYCDEGTPGYFSRVDSCGSLNSIPVEPVKPKEIIVKDKEPRRIKFSSETKAVKFEEVVNYAEETPLMFSRSSSLASLDSIEQHSIHDDRSSVVSDFSRLTSGMISPSELPDSPTQTVPPSPKPRKTPIVYPDVLKNKAENCRNSEDIGEKSTVFEDDVKKFKMESTPLEFSTATSLSSLLLDDCEESVPKDKDDTLAVKENDLEINLDMSNGLLDGSEDEDDILAACINIGMQKNRYSQQKSNTPPPLEAATYSTSVQISNSVIKNVSTQKSDITSDSLRNYCTEDTPAILSHAGSNSNLSILSIIGNEKLHDSSNVEDDEHILDAQIDNTITSMAITNEKILPHANYVSLKTELPSTSKQNEKFLTGIKEVNNPISSGLVHDSVRNYYTEDTPAILSHAGSHSDLSVLSMPGTENEDIKDYFSDLDCNSDEEDDEQFLNECVRFGMAKTTAAPNINNQILKNCDKDVVIDNYLEISPSASGTNKHKVDLNISLESNASEDGSISSSVSSISDDSYESEQALLQECILAGMPKPQSPVRRKESNDLSQSEKTLLQQCILDGMKKFSVQPRRQEEDDSTELTAAEKALLKQCILSGMPKNRNLTQGGPSASRESTELTASERLLLQQCILAGMPKNKTNKFNNANVVQNKSKQLSKRGDRVGQGVEHSCCVHCPRNQKNQANKQANVRVKRKGRGHEKNAYMANPIFTKKKEFVERSHEEWI